jgi:hypothetical protein
VGYITYSARGHSVGKMLAMAYVRTEYTWPGCNLVVDIGGRLTLAKVTPTPFFDPQGARMRAKPQDDALLAAPQPVAAPPPPPADAPPRLPEEDAPPPDRSGETRPDSVEGEEKSSRRGSK